jgi:hypothetical protein
MKTLPMKRVRVFACAMLLSTCLTPAAFAQTAPPLGTAAAFGVLGGSTVTNTGPTVVQGDVGTSPGSAIVGFPPGIAIGALHAADAVAAQAQSDTTIAFNALAAQAPTTNLTGQDLGGLTLTPGVYDFNTSAALTGTLTLDAQGNAGAVFIFRTGSTLVTASGARVVVINGGSGCNVFWQVGSSATFGTGSTVVGNVLALTSITLNTGSSVSGRLLARNGAVTLDSNTVSACAAGACAALAIAPRTIPTPIAGNPYAQTFTASGGSGPYVFSVASGNLPQGLALAPSGPATATVSGVAGQAAPFAFALRVTDAAMCSAVQGYSGNSASQVGAVTVPAASTSWLALLAVVLGVLGFLAASRRER